MKRITSLLAIIIAACLALAGCAGGDSPSTGDSKKIKLGFLPSWTDGLITAYLLDNQLTKMGYDVEMKTLTEAGPLYTGLARGDVDIYPSAWPELTHAQYMKEYGDRIEDLGAYYDNAQLTIVVPEYVDIDSIADLKGQSERFNGIIYGIEPGAGLTLQTQEVMLPAYGLDAEYQLLTSSTAAMLIELDKAIKAERDIVVTMWRPFWANDAFPVKDLADPLGGMGGSESLHFLGTAGFSESYPEVADFIEGIQLSDADYASLEDIVVNEYGEGREAEAVAAWIQQNPNAFPGLLP